MRPFLIWLARRCVGLLVAFSLLLSLLAAVLWYASLHSRANLSLELEKKLIEVRFIQGAIHVERTSDWPGYDMLGMSKSLDFQLPDVKKHWGVTIIPGHPVFYQIYSPTLESLGVERGGRISMTGDRPRLNAIKVIFPAWYPLVITAIPPAVYLIVQGARAPRRITRSRRKKKGLCLKCGYDLRESQERCPECGEIKGGPATEAK